MKRAHNSQLRQHVHDHVHDYRLTQQKNVSHWVGLAFPDIWLLICWVTLMVIGMVMVSSASIAEAVAVNLSPTHYIVRQGCFYIGSLLVAYIAFGMSARFFEVKARAFLLFSIVLIILLYVPGMGVVVNGARRWINLRFFNLQVGEVVKLSMVIYAANFLARNNYQLGRSWSPILRLLGCTGVFSFALLLQPDFGTTMVMVATVLGMMFLADVSLWRLMVLGVGVLIAMSMILIAEPYRVRRLVTFLEPFEHQFGEGYQLVNSLIAFGRGGVSGAGLGESVQKHQFLPEAHTDFIFSIIGEEMGMRGCLVVMLIFAVLVWRAFSIGRLADRVRLRFSCNLAYGIGLWIAIQTLVNIGVTTGVLPTKGLTLPLVSYGGSSTLVTCVALGILARIDAEARHQARREGII